MPKISVTNSRRSIAILTALLIAFQSVAPSGFFGANKALADEFPDTGTYEFEFAADYTTGDNAMVVGNVLHARLTWELQSGGDIAGASIGSSRLLSPESAGVVLLVDRENGNAYRSTDSGDNWAEILNGAMDVFDIVETTNDGSTDLVAVGDDGVGDLVIMYSQDYGATWSPAAYGFATAGLKAESITYDPATNDLWALTSGSGGAVATSLDGGENWTLTAGAPDFTFASYEIIAVGNGDLVVSGSDGGGDIVAYSLDDGASWTEFCMQVGGVGVCDPDIQTFGLHNGYVYASDQSNETLFRALATEINLPLGWNSISSDPAYIDSFYSTGDILFASSNTGGLVYSSLNNGDSWVEHAEAAAGVSGLGITRLYNDDRFLWVVQDGATTSAYIADPYTSDAWAIPEHGFLAAEINSIAQVDFHAASESTEVSLAFNFDANPAGTWYYHDGADWVSGVGTNSTFSTPISDLTGGVLQSFDDEVPFTDSIFIRIYLVGGAPDPNPPITILDYLEFDYDPATITVTSPNGGEDLAVGTQTDITWTSSGGIGTVDLDYSTDNGAIWNPIAVGEANDGTYQWTVPNAVGSLNLVRVVSGAISDTSDANFEIVGGGGGGSNNQNDDEPPYSEADDLPVSTSQDSLDISVTAYDDRSGVEEVYLYYSYQYEATEPYHLIAYGDPMHGCPDECFEWEFDFPLGEGRYYFYSSAIDFDGNDSFAYKFGGQVCEGNRCEERDPEIQVEAQTIFDNNAPFVQGSRPINASSGVARNGEIELRLSEPVVMEGFDYNFFHYQNGQKISDRNKLDSPYFPVLPDGGYCPPNMLCAPERAALSMVIPYSNLAPNTEYFFTIRHLYDLAGNDLIKNAFEQPENITVWRLSFRTAGTANPDLSTSTLNIDTDQKYGFFAAGDVVPFIVTLRNTSPTPANMATATLSIADGLTYCSSPAGSYCAPATATSGNVSVVQDGDQTRINWVGSVISGNTIDIRFWATVDDPEYAPSIIQYVTIDDGVNDFTLNRYDIVYLTAEASLSASTKIGYCYINGSLQRCDRAYPSALVTYVVNVVNDGTLPSNTTVVDPLPAGVAYTPDTLRGDLWDSLTYNPTSKTITALGVIPPNSSLEFSFTVEILPGTRNQVTNTAQVHSDTGASQTLSFSTLIDLRVGQLQPPQIAHLSPTPEEKAVALSAPIEIGFTKSIDTQTFGATLKLGESVVNISGWQKVWAERNGIKNALVKVVPPAGFNYEIDATYTAAVNPSTKDLEGNVLSSGPYSNPWNFTTIAPGLRIVKPTAPIVQVAVGDVSPELVVEAVDINSGLPYVVEKNVPVAILAEVPSTGQGNFNREVSVSTLFGTNPKGDGFRKSTLSNLFKVVIPTGQSSASFYLKDSVRNILTVTAFPDPYIGWSAGQKAVWIMAEEEINLNANRLEFALGKSSVGAGNFSQPIKVKAVAEDGTPMFLPSTLYFHTESPTGAFYDANFKRLPDMVTIAALNPTTNLQMAENLSGSVATFYYMDDTAGAYLLTASDNAPLQPDTELANGYAIMTVVTEDLLEEDIFAELENVVDDTGRVLDRVEIAPAQTIMLPGDTKNFAVVAYDTLGNPIENAKFKWYVIAGGGTIAKDGVGADSHQSEFVAGQDLGIFYDTVLVATLYNGQFGFSTASVQVTDLVDYTGDGLPITGINGLQLIFMSLTLVAAVALAWVEHYDKTHKLPHHETPHTSASA